MKKQLFVLLIASTLFGCNNSNVEKEDDIDKQFSGAIDQTDEALVEAGEEREEESNEESWNDPNYDYFAYKLTARTEGERDGESEYYYTGNIVNKDAVELQNIESSPKTNKTKEVFKFWRSSVDFTPESGAIVLVKFPKDNYEEFEDIGMVYAPTGEFYWSHE